MKRIFKYLKGSLTIRLTYGATSSPHVLTAYSDADFAADLDDRKSRSRFVLMLNGAAIAWGSRKQQCTASTTTESEYVAAHLAANEISWMRGLLRDLGYEQSLPTPLYCDNQAAIRLVMNPVLHKQTKHINVKFHILREYQANGEIAITCIPSADQLADILTKPLPRDKFQHFRTLMGLTCSD